MLGALHARSRLQPLLPFARQFYAAPSTYTWYTSRALNLMPTRDDIAIPSAVPRPPAKAPAPAPPTRTAQVQPVQLPRSAGPPRRPPRGLCHLRRPRHARAAPGARRCAGLPRSCGARVARHVKLADMNLDVPVADEQRIEVVANGLPFWHGSQLALDATIVSLLTRRGEAHPRADVQSGCAVLAAARRKRCQTHPELGRARHCRLVVVGIETGFFFHARNIALPRPANLGVNSVWGALGCSRPSQPSPVRR